jgi:apolipoprotein D and lipocalin family protein
MRSTAHYEKLDAEHISVFNTCYKWNGGVSTSTGYANVLDPAVPTTLLVHFKIFGLLHVKGDYWIVDLGKDYDYAVVSGPGKSGLFILSREAPMAQEKLDAILASLKARGFAVDNLVFDRYDAQQAE